MPPFTRRSKLNLWATLLLVIAHSQGFSQTNEGGNQETWSFQDGCLVLTQDAEGAVLSFPYIPFLAMPPAWIPAYPRLYQQPVEPVMPLSGLQGKITLHLTGTNTLSQLQVLSRSPYSAEAVIRNGSPEAQLSWICPLEKPGVFFECAHLLPHDATLEIRLSCFRGKNLWATPGKKLKRDWGFPSWEWKTVERCLLQTCGNPVDATHSPMTALWIGENTPEWKGPLPFYQADDPQLLHIRVPIEKGGKVRFGFVHADNRDLLESRLAEIRDPAMSLPRFREEWETWLTKASQSIKTKTGVGLESLTPEQKRVVDNNLLVTRGLFLSNGAVLTEPMRPDSFPVSIAEQGVALNHWRQLGLEYPFLQEQAELSRHNRVHQRSISIPVLRSGGLEEALGQGRIILTSPDPQSPPDKSTFDTILGYVISGGHLTLVDGVKGFRGKEGWWKEAGAADLADYAIRMMGVPVDFTSRRTLDEEGLSPTVNTFLAGTTPLTQGTSPTPQTVTVQLPKPGGYVCLCPSAEDQAGIRILSGRIGGDSFRPFSAEEERFLAGGYAPRVFSDRYGETIGCELIGEGFRAYRIPSTVTGPVEFSLSGSWNLSWSDSLPATHLFLRKKAFQSWYSRELMQVPVSRLCHPVIYSGTYTCRVFDVSGTEESPFLFTRVGRGTFVWLGLPRDYLLLGSDTGSDLQFSLRNDPTYDMVRLTFAFHDPKRAGAERTSRPPLSGWGMGWSQSSTPVPEPFHAFFAWKPVETVGMATQVMNGWVEDAFMDTLEFPRVEGLSVPGYPLITRELENGHQILDLPDNAFRHALYKRLEHTSKVTGRAWLEEDARRKANSIASSLPLLLEGFGEGMVCARTIVDGLPGAAIPASALLPRAAWAATEISPADFPGQATAQAHLLNTLLKDPVVTGNPQALAVIATRDGSHREQFLGQLLAQHTDPKLGLIGREGKRFDLATAIPAVRALILSAKK